MLSFKRNVLTVGLIALFTVGFTGCSLKDPFGVGYDASACEDSKNFGVCGSPKNIYKHRDKIRSVQKDYVMSGIEQELFFAIDKDGSIMVKDDREGSWEPYDYSEWKELIDERNMNAALKIESLKEQNKATTNIKKPVASYENDLPVTKETDLSIRYQKQGPLVVSRTKVGDIIRDNGQIQQVFVANYVDYSNDLVASHEIYVVTKDPKWVVGERTPKSVKIDNLPTPISSKLLKSTMKTTAHQEKVVNQYNLDQKSGVMEAVLNDPDVKNKELEENMNIINSFLRK